MKLLPTIVALLCVSPASAAGWGRPQGQHLSTFHGSASTTIITATKETARSKAAANKALSKKQKGPLATRGGDKYRDFQNKVKTEFRKRIGDVGNIATIVLSVYLLVESLKVMGIHKPDCTFGPNGSDSYPCTPKNPVDSILDSCYVCDAFCTSRRTKPKWNSHMTSLYVDLLMSVPVYFLRLRRPQDLCALELDDYFLNSQKAISVAGHGTAHWFLSYLMFKDDGLVGLGNAGVSLLLGLMLGAFLISPETMWKLKTTFGFATGDYHVASIADKQTHEIHTKRVNHVGFFLAPFGMIQGMARSGMSSGASPLGLLIFGAAAFLFFTAGAPPTIPSIYAVVSAVALTAISSITIPPSGADDFGPGFTLIFTSAYVYSAFTQLFLWKEKKDFSLQKATSYALNSWLTAFLTTCVGWALGLNCTSLIKWGGHALYDFSIPLSYFLLYLVAKKFKVKEN